MLIFVLILFFFINNALGASGSVITLSGSGSDTSSNSFNSTSTLSNISNDSNTFEIVDPSEVSDDFEMIEPSESSGEFDIIDYDDLIPVDITSSNNTSNSNKTPDISDLSSNNGGNCDTAPPIFTHKPDTLSINVAQAIPYIIEDNLLLSHILQSNAYFFFPEGGVSSGDLTPIPQFFGVKTYTGYNNKHLKHYGYQLYYYGIVEDAHMVGVSYLLHKVVSNPIGTIQNDSVSILYALDNEIEWQWQNVLAVGHFSKSAKGHVFGLHTELTKKIPVAEDVIIIPQWGISYYNNNIILVDSSYNKIYGYHYDSLNNILGTSIQYSIQGAKFHFTPGIHYQIEHRIYYRKQNEKLFIGNVAVANTIAKLPFVRHNIGFTLGITPQYYRPLIVGYNYIWHKNYYNHGISIQLKFDF